MFRRLSQLGGTPREVSEIVNNLLNGKINSTGSLLLNTGGATSTTLYDERISPDSKIIILPSSAASLNDSAPYGEFLNTNDQLAPSAGSTAVVAWDTTVHANGTSISNTSRINVENDGVYAVLINLQLQNSHNHGEYADVWFRVNGTDVANSGRRFFIPARKSASDPAHVVGVITGYMDLSGGDYVEVAGSVSNTTVTLEHFAADAGVPRPAISAAMAKIEYIEPQAYSNIYVTDQVYGQATVNHFANSTADKIYSYVVLG